MRRFGIALAGIILALGVTASVAADGLHVSVSQTYDQTWLVLVDGTPTTYPTFAEAKGAVDALAHRQIVNVEWHGVYTAFAKTSIITFACDDADNIAATECAMNLATRANLPVESVNAVYNP